MPHHLEFEQWVPFPIERMFAFFSNPENLPRIMPAESGTRLISLNRMPAPPPPPLLNDEKAAGVGTIIVTSFRVFPFLPFRAQWIARITEFEWNHHFSDVQDKGPFKRWHHRHEFHSEMRQGMAGKWASDFSAGSQTRCSSAARCSAHSSNASKPCRNSCRRCRKFMWGQPPLRQAQGRPSAVRRAQARQFASEQFGVHFRAYRPGPCSKAHHRGGTA
jgi:ligand-binding SRPBCC domain-containing protein